MSSRLPLLQGRKLFLHLGCFFSQGGPALEITIFPCLTSLELFDELGSLLAVLFLELINLASGLLQLFFQISYVNSELGGWKSLAGAGDC